MIHATGLTKHFGDHAVLADLELDVTRGERVSLLGLNGSGKTTLFRCFLGLIPFEGTLEIDGLDVHRQGRTVRAQIGYVPQRPPHFHGTLAELVDFFGGLRGLEPEAVRGRLADLDLPLDAHADKPVRALSGGMLQKTLLALATAAEASLLLLDEPTANLDPRARREFVRALKDIPPETTVFLSSHRLEDIRAVTDRLLVLHAGRLVFDGSIDELEARAQMAETLWIGLAPPALERLAGSLAADPRVARVHRNGTRLGVEARPAVLPGLLADIREAGVEVLDLKTEAPPLESVLERFMETELS